MNFACFGFKKRDCIISLAEDGTVTFRAGMISAGPGDWRVVAGDPDDGERPEDCFLEMTQPVTTLYKELYNVPGGIVYWRGKINEKDLSIEDGLAISETQLAKSLSPQAVVAKLQGIQFQKEGTFSATLITEDTTDLPQPVSIEFMGEAPVVPQQGNYAPKKAAAQTSAADKSSPTGKRRIRKKATTAPDKGFGGSN